MSSGNKNQKALEAQTQAAVQATNTVTPAEQYANEQLTNWKAWQAKPGQDITSAPNMNFATDVYGNANTMAAKSRVGSPGNAFTANLPGFNNQLKSLTQENLYNTRAEGLSNAFQQAQAQALGLGAQGAQLQQARENIYAGAQQGYLNSWVQNRPTPVWQTIAGIAVNGLAGAGKLATGGASLASAGGLGKIFT